MTKIEWTEETWNPLAGCTMISPGCEHCYAMRQAHRMASNPLTREIYAGTTRVSGGRPKWTGMVRTIETRLEEPRGWKRPRKIFVNSMSDLFHEGVPSKFIRRVFDVMNEVDRHQYQILTKRAERLEQLSPDLKWGPNIWMGVSVESAEYLHRIEHLRDSDARVKFLSLEPLLGPLGHLDLEGIDWVIVGGESGPGARPMQEEWVRSIRDQCADHGVPFFFKQWGGVRKEETGRTLDGRTWDQYPEQRREGSLL